MTEPLWISWITSNAGVFFNLCRDTRVQVAVIGVVLTIGLWIASRPEPHGVITLAIHPQVEAGLEVRCAEEDRLLRQFALNLRFPDGFELRNRCGETLLLQRSDGVTERFDVISDGTGTALTSQGGGEDSNRSDAR